MTVFELMSKLGAAGIKLWLEEGQLKFKAPKGALTPELKEVLVAKKSEVIEFLSATRVSSDAQEDKIPVADRNKPLPLSFAQQRMWFIEQLIPANSTFHIPAALFLNGLLDREALDTAFAQLLERHESLRTRFSASGEEAVQIIDEQPNFRVHFQDLTHLKGDEQLAEARHIAEQEIRKPFDLENGPVIRARLLKLADNRHALIVVMHHIVSDGWSMDIFVREISALYAAARTGVPAGLEPLEIQYADYAAWQRQWLKGELLDTQIDYWRKTLANAPEQLVLPYDRPRPEVKTSNGSNLGIHIPEELTQKLRSVARELDVTLYVLLLAAYKVVLAKWSGQKDICVGMPVAGRKHGQIENLIGFFVNTLVIRSQQSDNPTLAQFVGRLREQVLAAQAHQDVPLEAVVEALNVPRNLAFSPLYQVAFSLTSGREMDSHKVVGGLTIEPMDVELVAARQDITLMLLDKENELSGVLEYNTDLFDRETMERFVRHFFRVLDFLVESRDLPVNAVTLETNEAVKQLLGLGDEVEAVLPLTPLQRDFVLDSIRTPDTVRNTVSYLTRIPFAVDTQRWRAALAEVVAHQPSQRTRFVEPMKPWLEPVYQAIQAEMDIEFAFVDLTEDNEGVDVNDDNSVTQWARQLMLKPFKVLDGVLSRHWLVKLASDRFLALSAWHHTIIDGASELNRIKQVLAAYFGHPVTHRSVEDYANWVEQRRALSDTADTLAYWSEQLRNVEPLGYRAKVPGQLQIVNLDITGEQKQKLLQWCDQHKVSLANLLRSLYALSLKRCYYQSEDIALIEAVAARSADEADHIGCVFEFSPALFKSDDIEADISVTELLGRAREWRKTVNQHIHLSFSGRSQVLNTQGLEFQFNYWLPEVVEGFEIEGHHCVLTPNQPDNPGVVKLIVSPGKETLRLRLSYYDKEFEGYQLADRLASVLNQIVAGTDQIQSLDWLFDHERTLQLEQWQGRQEPVEFNTVVEAIEHQVQKTPTAPAIICNQQILTFEQLNKLANQVGHYLLQQGVQKGQRIALAIDRCVELPALILGVIKVGAVYVPIDPAYPSERIAYLVEDSQASHLIAEACVQEALTGAGIDNEKVTTITRTDLLDAVVPLSEQSPEVALSGEDPIYVIYTSGSTGKPKGAELKHSGEANLIHWYVNALEAGSKDRFLLASAIGFDLTLKNFFAPLVCGGALVLPDEETFDPELYANMIARHGVTVVNCAPSVFYPIAALTNHSDYPFKSLRYLVLGGEPIRAASLAQWMQATEGSCRLINSYGPTECTDVVAAWSTDSLVGKEVLPIGHAIPNVNLYVLDRHDNLLPNGVAGELCVGGVQVGNGYLHRPQLNHEVFTPNPFGEGKIYHTGDLVRYNETGELVYIGRKDFQVKLRGLRIEPGEIDALLKQQDGVADALTLVDQDMLVSYVVTNKRIDQAAIKAQLQQQLPPFMVPSFIVELAAWPLTPNGKIDRKALTKIDGEALAGDYVAPRNKSEQIIADIWAQILKLPKVGVTTNFFDVGGHSLLATQVVSRIRQAFGIEMSVRMLFESPTIEQLVNAISNASSAGYIDTAPPMEKADPPNREVLSFAQHRLWFIDQLNQGSSEYNMPAAMRIRGPLDTSILDRAFTEIVRRHETLRTNFANREGTAVLLVRDPEPWTTEIVDLSQEPDKDQAISTWFDQDANKVFNLENDPLFTTKLLRLGDDDYVLLINMHHIVSDGWSIGVLIQELKTLYSAFEKGQASPLPDLPIQYSDFAVWQRNWLQGDELERLKSYWIKQLEGAPEVLRLPTDFPRPKQMTFNGAHFPVSLGEDLTAKVNQFCQQHDFTPFMVLMGAYQVLLSRYCSQNDVCVGIPIAGRNRAEIEGLIGFFVNGLVIRTQLDGNPAVVDYLEQVKEAALGAYSHQDMPADVLADALKLSRSAEHAPGAQVGFALQNTPIEMIGSQVGNLSLEPVYREHKTAKYEFSLILQESEENIAGVVEYNTDLFKESTIEQMMRHFNNVLRQMVDQPQTYIDHLDLVTESELYELLGVNPETHELYPLSPMQRDQYLDIMVEPDSLKNSMGYQGITEGEFNFELWQRAAQQLVDDQPLLRCRFIASDLPYTDVAYHLVEKKKTIEIEYIDLSDQQISDEQATEMAKAWIWRPYDTTNEDLCDYRVYKLNGGRHMCCFRMNHMVADGVGMGLHAFQNAMLADAFKAGNKPMSIPPLFFDHVRQNRVRMDQPDTLAYWKAVGQDLDALDFSLPPDYLEEAKEPKRVEKRLRVNDELWEKIKAYCKDLGIHPSLYFKTLYGMLINVYCRGENDFYISEVLSGRTGMHKMTFGNYFQILPVVFPQELLNQSSKITDLFDHIKNYKKRLKKKGDISLLRQRHLLPQGRLAFMFNYYNFIPTVSLHGSVFKAKAYPQSQDGPIQYVIHEQDGWMEMVLIYMSNLFTDLRFLERIEHISQQIVSGSEKMEDLEFILPDEKEKQLYTWRGIDTPLPAKKSVLDLIIQQAYETPDAIAVKQGDQSLTYAQLHHRSNQLANYLNGHGVYKGDRVGICLDRSVDMLTAVLGVLKSGAAYVPMDSHYPGERLAYMMEDSRAPVLITQQCVQQRLKEENINLDHTRTICLDTDHLVWQQSEDTPHTLPDAQDLIYIIYTSGSTGQPKGAMVKHAGENNLQHWYTEALQISEQDKALLISAFGFDLTQKNLFAVLTKGGTLVIPEMDQYDVEAITQTLNNEGITLINCAPSAFYPLVENTDAPGYPYPKLRYAVLGGESIRLNQLQDWLDHPDCQCQLMNSYGPTECTDVVSSHVMDKVPAHGILPIGKPIPNTHLYVVNEQGKLLPEGVVGELCISGAGVGDGYLHREELTRQVFQPNKATLEGIWYRTGDLVRYWSDGNLEYMGRKDFQVKLRGLRIELGEIESALARQQGVHDSLTLVHDDQLVSYVIADESLNEGQIRNALRSHLPDYMLPSHIVILEQWPLTPNGKIDRKALPSPDQKESVEYVAPRNETEQKLASIWSDVLGIEKVGVYDNFFDLGGHSLLAARAVSKFRREFDVEIPLRALFELHTVADIANYLDTLKWAQESAAQAGQPPAEEASSENRDEGFL